MEIKLAQFSFVAMIGISGSGKSHFAQRHFPAEEIVSLAQFAAITGDDGSDEALHAETLALMYQAIEIRLKHRKATIVDAELRTPKDRAELRRLARKYHVRLAAIHMQTPLEVCIARNEARPGSPDRVELRQQYQEMEETASFLKDEGLRPTYVIRPEDQDIRILRYPAQSDLRHETGPFDIIGDVHGCLDELLSLIEKLGYEQIPPDQSHPRMRLNHPKGRRLVFVGDLCDRGPDSPGVYRLVMDAVKQGTAFCVPGNHDDKLLRKLKGNNVQMKHGLEKTVAQLEGADPAFLEEMQAFIDGLSSHIELDGGKLVVAHAGLKESMHGRQSGEIQSFCLYGETTGETDEFGLPVRQNWAADYQGKALVVYGHTPIPEPSWQNNTVNIDTGCVFGGELTALRYPERSTIAVPAREIWSTPTRPMHWVGAKKASKTASFNIDMNYTSPKVLVSTTDRYHLNLEDATFIQVIEHLSNSAVHLGWMIFTPPSYGPPTPSTQPQLLEHPAQAIDYYRKKGVTLLAARPLVHGTRVVIVLCKDTETAQRRFGIQGQGIGAIYTRSGKPYFDQASETQAWLDKLSRQMEVADLWTQFKTDWICIEAVVAPLSHKAPAFVPTLYGSVTALGEHASKVALQKLEMASKRGLAVTESKQSIVQMQESIRALEKASLHLAKPAPRGLQWHLAEVLAVEGHVVLGQSQDLHQAMLTQIAQACGPEVEAMPLYRADLDSDNSLRELVAVWEKANIDGGAGLRIGPLAMNFAIDSDLLQPWIQVRCAEYLRLLYGPAYDVPANLQVLRERNLRAKRETVVRSYSLSREALTRFVTGQNFQSVFQCSFNAMGLEIAVIDPRM